MVHSVRAENFAWRPTNSCHQRCTSLDYSECALKHLNGNISAAAVYVNTLVGIIS